MMCIPVVTMETLFKTKAINKLIRTLTYTSKKWRLTIY